MGRDPMSVVDSDLKVYGIERLRIADGSIMPRVATGNTSAPCVIIGERAAEIIRNQHQIEALSLASVQRHVGRSTVCQGSRRAPSNLALT